MTSLAKRLSTTASRPRGAFTAEPRELISGIAATGPLAQVQAYLAVGAALTGAIGALLPHPPYFNVAGLLAVQALALGYGLTVLVLRKRISYSVLRLGNLLAAVLTTAAVYFSGDSASGYAVFYLWIGFYVFYYPVSRLEAAVVILWGALNYAIAIAITPTPTTAGPYADIHFFAIVVGTLLTAGALLTYLRHRNERLVNRLVEASRTDPLTQLANRVGLHLAIEREIERGHADMRPVSLLIVDVDRFKQINERYGISGGDDVLKRLASLMVESTRLIDTLARSGGEEFAILMPETNQHQAYLSAEEMLSRIRRAPLTGKTDVSASIGISTFPANAATTAELVARADQALHAAKALGRDRAVIYTPEVTATVGAVAGRRNIQSQAQLATVLSLAEALDQRDSGTAKHSQTVGMLSEMMARELGLDDDRVQRVRLAGILHDIGKIGVPDSILRKPEQLTEPERVQMQRHPELGARILSSGELDDVREWILAHHERPDGTGYPKGLTEDQIPLEASILAVADAYEAMTSDRVYRMAIGPVAAREELIKCSGTQFDARVAAALLNALATNAPAEFRV